MLENLGPGKAAFFVDVSDENYRNAAFFCEFEECGSTFANLADASGRRVESVAGDSLD